MPRRQPDCRHDFRRWPPELCATSGSTLQVFESLGGVCRLCRFAPSPVQRESRSLPNRRRSFLARRCLLDRLDHERVRVRSDPGHERCADAAFPGRRVIQAGGSHCGSPRFRCQRVIPKDCLVNQQLAERPFAPLFRQLRRRRPGAPSVRCEHRSGCGRINPVMCASSSRASRGLASRKRSASRSGWGTRNAAAAFVQSSRPWRVKLLAVEQLQVPVQLLRQQECRACMRTIAATNAEPAPRGCKSRAEAATMPVGCFHDR